MTSGNRSDEPIVVRDDAIEKLAGIADLYLTHNRPIHVRCDDSVTRVIDGTEMLVRRSRGYAPKPIALPFNCPRPILALGGQLKSTFAIAQGRDVFLSHHLGDLDNLDAFRAYESDIQLYEQLFALKPELLAHDLHPDYRSTHYALDRSARTGTPLQAIQHHHAHMASCTAENGLMGSAIGVIFDGTGYGTDGTIWGGEFLVGGYGEFRRVGHLRHIAMPDSEKAVQQPWRMALAYLIDSECDGVFQQCGVSRSDERIVRTMLQRGFNSPSTSSAGRLFDAVAASLAVRTVNSYD
jgi:hydrogenase maturation protein HypF